MAHRGDEFVFHPVQRVALADVAEAEHAAHRDVVLHHWCDRELDRERGPISAVENILATGALSHQEGSPGAALIGTLFPPFPFLMHYGVHGAADQVEGV